MIHVGVTPAGSEWNVRPRTGETREQMLARVEVQRVRLNRLWDKHNSKLSTTVPAEEPAPKTLPELQEAYKAARSRMYKRAAKVRKAREVAILKAKGRKSALNWGTLPDVWTDAEYLSIRANVANLNKAIKKAKKTP